jgi:SPP1 family phage portal protein
VKDNFKPGDLGRRDADRMRRYRELLDFYQGVQWPERERRGEKRLTFNYARVVVDKMASYLMSGVKFVVDPGEDTAAGREKARRAEAVLQQVYDANGLEQLDFETEIDCSVLGDATFKVTWDTETGAVRVTAPDVQGIYLWQGGDDAAKVRQVASRYYLDVDVAAAMYGVKPKGKTTTVVEMWTADEFELWVDDTRIEQQANPYGFIPFVIFPNVREPKKTWGASDLTQLMEPLREFNRAMSQLSRILELSGNPVAVLENVEESEDIAVKPGAVWNIPESAKAYLLDLLQGGGVQLHLDYINLLYRTMHDVSESPRAAFGGNETNLSGVALEMELQPLLQKVNRKRAIRTVAYNQRNRMILNLMEKYHGDDFGDYNLKVVWSPVLPRDMTQMVANEQVLVQGGIHSRHTAMYEVGVKDPETEFARWLEERDAILKMNRDLNVRPSKGTAGE